MACKCHFQPPFMHFKLFKSSTQKNKMKEANAVAYLLLLHCSCSYGTFPKKTSWTFIDSLYTENLELGLQESNWKHIYVNRKAVISKGSTCQTHVWV